MATKGEYRVGIAFNPSNLGIVDHIKRAAADFIDLIETIEVLQVQDEASGLRAVEMGRLKALAQTSVEEAAMWAVKAATKPLP